jgi:hypothetical protein
MEFPILGPLKVWDEGGGGPERAQTARASRRETKRRASARRPSRAALWKGRAPSRSRALVPARPQLRSLLEACYR